LLSEAKKILDELPRMEKKNLPTGFGCIDPNLFFFFGRPTLAMTTFFENEKKQICLLSASEVQRTPHLAGIDDVESGGGNIGDEISYNVSSLVKSSPRLAAEHVERFVSDAHDRTVCWDPFVLVNELGTWSVGGEQIHHHANYLSMSLTLPHFL